MTTPAASGAPDLCEVVHTATGVPTICEVHKVGAPIYDGNVCCSDGACSAAQASACRIGQLYYCELGAETSSGGVVCYFEVPNYCDVFACEFAPTPDPQEGSMCCSQGICWDFNINTNDCELGDIFWCGDGATNADGTVSCFDE